MENNFEQNQLRYKFVTKIIIILNWNQCDKIYIWKISVNKIGWEAKKLTLLDAIVFKWGKVETNVIKYGWKIEQNRLRN